MKPEKRTQSFHVILRWISFLPAAFLSAYAVLPVFAFLHWHHQFIWGHDEGIADKIYVIAFQSFSVGYAFVFTGHLVAPSHKAKVAIALGSLGLILCGLSLVKPLNNWGWENFLSVLITAAAIAISVLIRLKESRKG
ncbi:MAG: hypothetical protein WCL04_04000 [Verrucomicrobiota bacterium]